MAMLVEPVTLTGPLVALVPLAEAHLADLAEAGRDPAIWRYISYGTFTDAESMARFLRQAEAARAAGTELPFAVIHRPTGRAIGSTRYLDIRPQHHALEIGGTWYATAHQRTGVNTECKALLLRHAFETLGAIRVQLKTDGRNDRSQRAIERIGARREGVLRYQMILPDGYRRDAVMYSILDHEWPEVKARLERLKAGPQALEPDPEAAPGQGNPRV